MATTKRIKILRKNSISNSSRCITLRSRNENYGKLAEANVDEIQNQMNRMLGESMRIA